MQGGPRNLRYRIRYYLMLMAAAALTAYGLIAWHDSGLSMEGLLLYDNGWRPHPLHYLMLGLGGLPPAMWEIFWQDAAARGRRRSDAEQSAPTSGSAAGEASAEAP